MGNTNISSLQGHAAIDCGETEQLFRLLEQTADAVCRFDAAGRLLWTSSSVETVLGWPASGLSSRSLTDLVSPDDVPLLDDLFAELRRSFFAQCTLGFVSADGRSRSLQFSVSAQPGSCGQWHQAVGTWRYIHHEYGLADQQQDRVRIDGVTGLPTAEAMHQQIDAQPCHAVVLIGIDCLATIHKAFGRRVGDRCVALVAEKLVGYFGSSSSLGRGIGDGFLYCVHLEQSRQQLEHLAVEIKGLFPEIVTVGDHQLSLTVSIGIALGRHGLSAEHLIHDAFLAMGVAAEQRHRACHFADPSLAEKARRDLAIPMRLREALARQELRAWFMPLVDLGSGQVRGYEALVRWCHPDGRVDTPDTFLPSAAHSDLAAEIDLVVLAQVIETLQRLPASLSVAANLTPTTLTRPNIALEIEELLSRSAIDPRRLHLEITESALLNRTVEIDAVIRHLAGLGVRWVLDDFGTGYSSICSLRDLPIQGLKLDRSFTEAIRQGDQKSFRLAQALAGLGEGLHLELVAEGIEGADEAAVLRDLGWQLGQGWLFGKPAPFDQLGPSLEACQFPLAPGPSHANRKSWALAVTDNVPVGLFAIRFTHASTTEMLFASRRCLQMLRLDPAQVSLSFELLVSHAHADEQDMLRAEWLSRADAGEAFTWQGRFVVGNDVCWFYLEAIPVSQVDGTIVWQGVLSEITKQKSQELYLQRILDEAPIPIALQELTGDDPKLAYVNKQFTHCFGYTLSDIPRLSDWAASAYPDLETRTAVFADWNARLARARACDGVIEELEAPVVGADGRVHNALFSAVVIGQQLVISVVDITPWRLAQRELSAARSALAETALAITEAIPVGTYTMVQPKEGGMGKFCFMSDRFLQICGLEREAAAADPLQAFTCVHPDDYDDWVQLNAHAFEHKLPFCGECRVVVNDQVRWVSAESVPRDLPDGSTVWEGVLIDITREKQAYERLQQERALLTTVLENVGAHVYMKDADGRYLYANPSVRRFLGLDSDRIVGYTDLDLLPSGDAESVHAFDAEVFASGWLSAKEEVLSDPQGDRRVFLSQKIVFQESESRRYLIGFSTDITDLRRATEQLAASEEHFRLLAENVSDVVFRQDDDGLILWVSPSLAPTLGWSPEEWIGCHLSDFQADSDSSQCQSLYAMGLKPVSPLVRERIRAKDGSWHWVEIHASVYRTASGDVDGQVGSFRLIDAEMAMMETLQVSEERYRLLAENASDVIWTMESDGRMSYVSPSVEILRGVPVENCLAESIEQQFAPESLSVWQSYWIALIDKLASRQSADSFRGELEYQCADGQTVWADVMALPVLNDHGDLQQILGVSRDITERKRFERRITEANATLQRMATTDELTGISNRRHLELIIRDAICRSDRYGDQLALILCDLDHFKRINDEHGHQAGDAVLAEFSRRVQDHIRKSDLFGRWGGEEFLLMLPHSNRRGACALAEALRKVVADVAFPGVGPVTASFGVALRRDGESEADWFARADQALYSAKADGRNRVCCD